jgi:hypothetical protein
LAIENFLTKCFFQRHPQKEKKGYHKCKLLCPALGHTQFFSFAKSSIIKHDQHTFVPETKFQFPTCHQSWESIRIQLGLILGFGAVKHKLSKGIVGTWHL